MPILDTEEMLDLAEARALFPRIRGKHPSQPTMWRWVMKGYRGVRLEHMRVGRQVVTSREAIRRFIEAMSEPGRLSTRESHRPAPPLMPKTPAAAVAASRQLAKQILDAARI